MIGQALNNPFFIRYSPLYHWAGFDSKVDGFVRFKSLEFGLRAAILCIRSYCRLGKLTPSSIILIHDFPFIDDNRVLSKRVSQLSGVTFISSVDDALVVLKAFLFVVDNFEVSLSYLHSLIEKYNISTINFFTNSKSFKNETRSVFS